MITGCSVYVHVHVTQHCYHHPPGLTKATPFCLVILGTSANKGLLFFIVIGSTVKSWPALGVVFEAPLADSHSALYSSIYNLEEQLAASVEKSLRDSYDYNIDENLQYMCLKKHICQYGQLKSKRINSPRRPFAALFRCWDPSSTADVKPSMKVFYFVWGLLHLNLHPNW